jgi:hypothetical protein
MKTSKRSLLAAGVGAAAAAALAVPLALNPADATTVTTALEVDMDGASEVPPADANGTGTVFLFAHESNPRALCYVILVDQIGTPTAAHIHPGQEGVVGDPVVPLKAPKDGDSAGCAHTRARLVARILDNPQNFYINVHNARFQGGAIRGQLG